MKKILVFGAFDLLHPGHIDFFRQAKELGDHLTVILGTDKNVTKIKGNKPLQDEQTRLKMVKNAPFVDEALLGKEDWQYQELIREIKPEIICLGYDQKPTEEQLKERLKQHGLENIQIIRLKPFKKDIFKSTKIKETFQKDV